MRRATMLLKGNGEFRTNTVLSFNGGRIAVENVTLTLAGLVNGSGGEF